MADWLTRMHGTGEEKSIGLFVDFAEQWSSLFRRCNWYDFTIIEFSVEFDPSTERWDVTAGLLGLKVYVQYVYGDEWNRKMVAEAESALATKLEEE